MDLAVEPDTYTPSLDTIGNYIDKIPSFNNLKNGLRCPCGARKGKIYANYSLFGGHIKTKAHQKWLADLNLNKANFYIENEELKQTITNQKLIISRMEKDINNKSMTIDYLTQQLNKQKTPNYVCDLLDFD